MIEVVDDEAAVAVLVSREGGRVPTAWAWWHDRGAALLSTSNVPREPGGAPWAAVVVRSDGTLVASANTTSMSGLYWSVDVGEAGPTLRFGVNPGAIVRSREGVTTLDEDYLRQFLLPTPPAHWRTPYAQIDRIATGTTLIWRPGQTTPTALEWCGPQAWGNPDMSGADAEQEYLRAFDAMVDSLMPEQGALSATLSGGLDSTFMVASLVRHATPDRPIHAYCYVPHPDVPPVPMRGPIHNESDLARQMERAYPGKILVHEVVNEQRTAPLDAAAQVMSQSWMPVRNVGNFVWLADMMRRAADIGAKRLFHGSFGNASFSYSHTYAAGYHLRRGQFLTYGRSLGDVGRARGWRSAAKAMQHSLRPNLQTAGLRPEYRNVYGLRDVSESAPLVDDRATFEQMLAGRIGLVGSLSTTGWPVEPVDPFAGADVVNIAARVEPQEWVKGELPRGFARRLGAGRVPDEIRLNPHKGIQSSDTWYAISDRSEEYLGRADALASLPVLGDWVDVEVLRRTLRSWPWGQPEGPALIEQIFVNRLLATADFISISLERLRRD